MIDFHQRGNMHPVTPGEKKRAFYRSHGCAESLFHDGIIDQTEFRYLVNRMVKMFGHPDDNTKLMENNEKKS